MNAWRSGCSATPLSSDQLLVVGGFDGSNHLDSTELLDLKDPWHMIGDWLYGWCVDIWLYIYIYIWWIKTTGCWTFDKFVYDLIQMWKLRALLGGDIDGGVILFILSSPLPRSQRVVKMMEILNVARSGPHFCWHRRDLKPHWHEEELIYQPFSFSNGSNNNTLALCGEVVRLGNVLDVSIHAWGVRCKCTS